MENIRGMIVENGMAYAKFLYEQGIPAVYAEKSGCILVRRAIAGESIPVYTQNGVLEAMETGVSGKFVVTKANLNGSAVVDEFGHENSWQMDEATLRKKYIVPEFFSDGFFARPQGGEQKFICVDRDVVFMVPWGEGGALVSLFVEKGGYMNVTNPDDIYGISARDFADTYAIIREEPMA